MLIGQMSNGIRVVETFEAEDANSAEEKRQGWHGIQYSFKNHVDNIKIMDYQAPDKKYPKKFQ